MVVSTEFLSGEEAARRMGVSGETARRLLRENIIPAVRTEGGHYRVREADLREYLRGQGIQPATGPVVIAVTHHAGGVGKTTTALNLAYALADTGRKVLVVDLDPQADLSERLKVEPLAPSLANILKGEATGTPARVSCAWEGIAAQFDVLPAVFEEMVDVDARLMAVQLREQRLARALAPLRKLYDVILLDCPPSLSLLSTNALWAADGVVIPVQAQDKALRQLTKIIASVQEIQAFRDGPPTIWGVVLTMAAAGERMTREVEAGLRAAYGETVFLTTIPRRTRLAEDARYNAPVALYAPAKDGGEAYAALAEEVIHRAHA